MSQVSEMKNTIKAKVKEIGVPTLRALWHFVTQAAITYVTSKYGAK